MTWVVSDYTAAGAGELSVTKGQQVEVMEVCASRPDYCLVRAPTRGAADHHVASGDGAHQNQQTPEGLVPLAVLKQPPPAPPPPPGQDRQGGRGSPGRTRPAEAEGDNSSNDNTAVNTSSPVNKRRGFSGRKWLPPPLRKLSQGKVDKTQSTPLDSRPPLKKTGSDKRIKVPSDMGNKPFVSEGEEDDESNQQQTQQQPASQHRVLKGAKSAAADLGASAANGGGHGDEPEEEQVELPPPMKPIQEPILVPPPPMPPSSAASTAAPPDVVPNTEASPGKREQHSENQERNSLLSRTQDTVDTTPRHHHHPHRGLSAQASDPTTTSASAAAASSAFSGDESDTTNGASAAAIDGWLRKRRYVLKELVDTEEAYVRDLSMVVDGYIATMRDPDCEIPMPEDLRDGKDKMVFGNIEAIYDWHRIHFLKALREAVENPVELAALFKRYERKLQMYVIYCKNKPVSEYIVSEYLDTYFEELRVKLGQKLQLCDLLIKPVQRIMKYQLMLKDILKYTEKAGLKEEIEPLRQAYEIMVIVPKNANDMMDVGRLQGFEGKITAQGKLLLHGLLVCSDIPGQSIVGKNKDLQVFLFEQSIIFSEVVGKKTQFTSPQYIYKAHIQVNKMSLDVRDEDGTFVLQSSASDASRSSPQTGFVCQAPNEESHDQWLTTVRGILQTQRDFLKAIQSPIAYQKELTKEASDLPWDPTAQVRRNAAALLSSQEAKNRKAPYVHKANTIGIPSEQDLQDSSSDGRGSSGTPRTRKNFFGGFRNTLRNKHKSDSVVLESGKEGEKNDLHRRWSEANHTSCETHVMAPGTQARVIREYPDLNLGEVVTIIKYDAYQGYLVSVNCVRQQYWVPASILTTLHRKPWSFRFRKPRRPSDGNSIEECTIPEGPVPEFRDRLKDITVQSGTKVVLKCRVINCTESTKQSWKKLEPNLCILRNGRFISCENNEGIASLTIDNVRTADSGTYSFSISNEYGSNSCSCILTVTNSYPPLSEPKIQVISSSSVLLEWNSDCYNQFVVEYCKLGSGEWISPNDSQPINCQAFTVENLTPGETYSFRVIATNNRLVSLPSIAVTLPVADNLRWQQEQFRRRYIELNEIGRGRYSVVRLAKDRGTNVEVALKQITRRRQPHAVTQAEYAFLVGIEHPNIIRSLALFDNAPLPGVDTIVLELVKGQSLFTYVCEKDEYREGAIRDHTRQLVSALDWLHEKDLAHLDVKPENVMVDTSTPTPVLKLIDFGDSVNTAKNVILPPACLEFASPELVLGQPVGRHTDAWAVGVFLYVLLSGVSPFLDDSMEETTANILKCDYCFPPEYFGEITGSAKELIGKLLVLASGQRLTMRECSESDWMKEVNPGTVISSSRLRTFMQRRHPINVTPTSPTYQGEHIF